MNLPVLQPGSFFECGQCGSCCKDLRGFMPAEDKAFMQEMAFGKLPIVQLVPVQQMTFTLWDWEAKRFNEWKKEKNIEAEIKPARTVLDLNSNRAIIVSYYIDADYCPFLKENKCGVYDKKRAYICRMFPFHRGPFLETGDKVLKEHLFGTCGQLKKIYDKIPADFNDMIPHLANVFPDGSFENMVQFDHINEWVNKTVIQLMKEKKMRPAINYPYDKFLKRFHNSEQLDLTDFLEEIGFVEDKSTLIGDFDNNKQGKAIIGKCL